MTIVSSALVVAGGLAHELVLFAAVGFVIGGISDLAIDVIWIGRTALRAVFVYSRHERADANTLAEPCCSGRIVVFVPAWHEAGVIEPMLRHAVGAWGVADWRIYVGTYPNDLATQQAVRSVWSSRVRLVVNAKPGPTTKADCLNAVWGALLADEAREGFVAKAVVLHDAEDVVHPAELKVYDRLIERFDLVQLPVLPLVDPDSRWIGGHYNDEFAESHGKTIVVREAIGAAIPSAGVGCAFARATLGKIADGRGGVPFDQDSLTEDYELGLRIAELGGRSAFVRLPGGAREGVVAVRAHFPATLETAVRQKARWIAGIALSGWDRLGWRGGFAERWMRLHDRRALVAALVLLAAYLGLVLAAVVGASHWLVGTPPMPRVGPGLRLLLLVSGGLLAWRLVMRFVFVNRAYGLVEGLLAVPRAVVANIVAMMAARRAVALYLRMRRDGVVRWDKTTHHFPSHLGA